MLVRTDSASYFSKQEVSSRTYLVPYSILSKQFPETGSAGLDGKAPDDANVAALIRTMLMGVKLDEAWYRAAYPDVAEAIAAGVFHDARHHFVANGYFEGRAPFQHTIDEDYYLRSYPDVADGIQSGIFSSAAEHFDRFGYVEGRLPSYV